MQARQMGRLAALISAPCFAEHFLRQFFEMCEDQVASVRETTARVCYPIARSFASDPDQIGAFMERVRAFKQSRKYTMRQTFLVMCESVINGDPKDQTREATA